MHSSELRKFVCPEFIFGSGAISWVGTYAGNWDARRVFLVTDPGVEAAGWANSVRQELELKGIHVDTFEDVTPNPRDHEVMAGAERYRSGDCDVIVAVGGGSVLDAAKGIGIVASNGGNILDYEGVDQIPEPMPPLLCVPTTSGTSADVSQFCIITDTGNKKKIAIVSKAVVPDLALIDPETLFTMDIELTSATGLDALTHAVEAYVSLANSFMTDRHALGAIELLAEWFPRVMKSPDSIEARTAMMQASLEAGLAFSNASLELVHSMAHALGGVQDLPHGKCNAVLLKNVCDFNYSACPERFDDVSRALGIHHDRFDSEAGSDLLQEAIDLLVQAGGIEPSLAGLGLDPRFIDQMASNALADACTATNPRIPSLDDVRGIYERTL